MFMILLLLSALSSVAGSSSILATGTRPFLLDLKSISSMTTRRKTMERVAGLGTDNAKGELCV